LGKTVKVPKILDEKNCFLSTKGNFMGGNIHLQIDYVVYVQAAGYLKLSEQDKYTVARQIGVINASLKGKNVMLIGPGRWGTTTPSLGVPVHFTELCNMAVICEVASKEEGFEPELSYGSHFFQDLVEADIFYVAIFGGKKEVEFYPEKLFHYENIIPTFIQEEAILADVIHIAKTDGMEIFSDILTQKLLCKL
jgi:hypothetical protein